LILILDVVKNRQEKLCPYCIKINRPLINSSMPKSLMDALGLAAAYNKTAREDTTAFEKRLKMYCFLMPTID